MKSKAAAFVPLALLMLCVGAFLGLFIHRGLVDLGRISLGSAFDFHSYFIPRFYLGARELSGGSLPLWNRFEYGGIPLLATTQPAALYPPTAIFFSLFHPETANWVWIVFHFVALAVVFLFFLREEGITGLSAYVGTSVWIFQTLTLASNFAPIRIANTLFIPLVILFANRTIERKSLTAFASLALCIALQLLAGYPEFFFDEALILVVHSAVCWVTKRWPEPPWKTLPIVGSAFALGTVAAAVQVVPLGELAVISRRSQIADVAHLLPVNWNEWLFRMTPGLLVFVALGFFVKKGRPASAGLLLCWVVSQGGWLLLRALPGFGYIRFPLVWILFAGHFTAWMAAVTMEALVTGSGFGDRGRKIVLAVVILASLALALPYGIATMQFAGGETPGSDFAKYLGTLTAAATGLAGSALLVVAAALAFKKRMPAWLWYAATTLVVLSHAAAYPYGKTPADFRRPSPTGIAARLHGDVKSISGRVLSLEDLLYGYEITDGLPSPLGVEYSFLPWRSRRLLEKLNFVSLFATLDWDKLIAARGFLNAMDVQYVAGRVGEAQLLAQARLAPVRRAGDFMLFENQYRLGHAWVNYAVRTIPDPEAALDYVMSPWFDPHNFVVLERPTRKPYPSTATVPVTPPLAERRHSAYDVEFDVDLPRHGIFVISESTYPGWKAIVDGKETPWLTADYFFKGVEVDAGKHTVRFAYRPNSVKVGIVLSALGIAAIVGLFLLARRGRAAA